MGNVPKSDILDCINDEPGTYKSVPQGGDGVYHLCGDAGVFSCFASNAK